MTQLACERDMAVEEKNKLKNRLLKVEQVKDEVRIKYLNEKPNRVIIINLQYNNSHGKCSSLNNEGMGRGGVVYQRGVNSVICVDHRLNNNY